MKEKIHPKLSQFLELVFNTFTARRVLIILIVSIVFFAKEIWVVAFINKFLKVPKEFSNTFLDIILIVTSLGFILWFAYLFLRRNYKASYTQILSVITILFLLFYFLGKADDYQWQFHSLFDSGLVYIYLLIVPLVVFLFFHFRSFKYPFKKIERQILPEHQLVQDNPKTIGEKDLLGYSKVVDELHKILISQESEKSITIGLVGPWGNGKSTVIQMLVDRFSPKETLEEKASKVFKRDIVDEYLLIHFLPYLNHQEDDLISEFFRELSSKLKPYNGKLSNLVLEYSKRLVDVYKNNVNLNFFDRHITSFEKTSAKEMYDDINDRLVETDKKILVFVDDLDRLNSKEILQVLKLIRNSADFTNVIFLVAMDKEYITRLLLAQKEILNSRFIDKFFQLEIYLPAIRRDTLRTIFKNLLLKRFKNSDEEFLQNLQFAIENKRNLFNDYIKNIRDVKRAVNQIVYEYPFTQGTIDLKDFLNFVFFKLKFPGYIKFINDDPSEILERPINSDLINLKTIKNDKNRSFNFYGNSDNYNYESLKNYKYFEKLLPENESSLPDEFKSYTLRERRLILKTLSYLFGNDNPVESSKSLKKSTNFKMLMEQRVFEEHILDVEFNKLKNLTSTYLKDELSNLFIDNKLPQLLDRIEYTTPVNSNDFEFIIETLVFLYDSRLKYNQYDSVLLKQLATQVDRYFKQKGTPQNEIVNSLKMKIFENLNISLESRLFLLSELWIEHRYNQLWQLGEEYVQNTCLRYYEEYLELQKEKGLWNYSDYTFYYIGNNLRKIDPIRETIIDWTKTFWNENNIELLCVQNINIEPWSAIGFKLSDNLKETFGSFEDFIFFVRIHKDVDKPSIIEIIDFLILCQRSEYRKVILFNFKVSSLMIEKVDNRKKDPQMTKEDYEDKTQLFFSSTVPDIFKIFRNKGFEFNPQELGFIESFENKSYQTMCVTIKRNFPESEIEKMVSNLLVIIQEIYEMEYFKLDKTRLWRKQNVLPDHLQLDLKLISIQPRKQPNAPKLENI